MSPRNRSMPIPTNSWAAAILAAGTVLINTPPSTGMAYAETEVQVSPPRTPTDQERLSEIQNLYGRSSYSQVIDLAQRFERDFPSSTKLPEVLNFKGLALLLTRNASAAAAAFEAALVRAPDALLGERNWKNYVRYNHAAALLEAGRASDAQNTLQGIDPETLDLPNRLKYFQLRARCFERQENIREALSIWITLDRRKEEFQLSTEMIISTVERLLTRVSSSQSLVEIEKQADGTSISDRIAFRSIQLLVEQGQTAGARDQLRLFLKNYPSSSKASEAASLLRVMRQNVTSGEVSLGLLLPQQGRFAHISQKIIEAATLATGVFGPNQDLKITLVVENSGDDGESALRALEKLHSEHKVAAVLGPVLSKGADAVIQRAEELAIPLVSLAQQQSGSLGEFSSQAAITPAMQTRELARQAIQVMGLKNFAILAPKDRFGTEYSQHFWNAVEEFGGSVTSFETYDSGETDFRKPIDRLAGLFYTDARERELTALAEEREQNKIKKKTRKTEKFFTLPPVVNFDAVFIADEPKTASFALPTFTYRDIDQVKFLGLSSWNSPDFIQRAQKSAEGAVFMDPYFPLARSPIVRDFSEKFRATFGQEATSLDAVAFDAALNLAKIVTSEADGGSVDRMRVASRIRQIRDSAGVTGKITVRDGIWTRDLRVLTIRDSEVVEWTAKTSPAPSPSPRPSSTRPATSAD